MPCSSSKLGRGKPLNEQSQEIVYNVYKFMSLEKAKGRIKNIVEKVAQATGISARSVASVVAAEKKSNDQQSPETPGVVKTELCLDPEMQDESEPVQDFELSVKQECEDESGDGSHEVCEKAEVSGDVDRNLHSVQCPFCGYTMTTKAELRKHMSRKHRSKLGVYSCNYCTYTASRRYNLESHVTRKHSVKSKTRSSKLDCMHNSSTAAQPTTLHIGVEDYSMPSASDLGVKYPFKCQHCDYVASTAGNLSRHVDTKHMRFKCRLRDHISIQHKRARPFNCKSCEYAATTAGNLRLHNMRKHSRERERLYTCKYCNYSTVQGWIFKQHMQNRHFSKCPEPCDPKEVNLTNQDSRNETKGKSSADIIKTEGNFELDPVNEEKIRELETVLIEVKTEPGT